MQITRIPSEDVLERFIGKVRDGEVGNLYPVHTKTVIDETWEACSHSLREPENIIFLNIDGVTKTYKLDQNRDVVEIVKDRVNRIRDIQRVYLHRYYVLMVITTMVVHVAYVT